MKKETNRKIFIITGSDCSGKSKLGHLLGSHKDALFSYATTPYQEFFDEENFKIYDSKIEALKKAVNRNFNYQNEGYTKDGRRWLKTDKLFYYDFNKINNYLRLKIKKNITISKFYFYWNEALMLGRKNGSKTLYTVFEIENLFNDKVVNHLKSSNKNLKIINIYRNPLEQIKSLKINILLRGGVSKNGFNGALSGKSNPYNYSITSIIKQYIFIKNSNKILHIKLNELKPINLKIAKKLCNYLFNKNNKNLIFFLIKNSRLSNYKNKYIDLKRESQSFRSKNIQLPFNLKFLINKHNVKKLMYSFEKLFYVLILKSLNFKELRNKKLIFYYLSIMSLIFGFKDIRNNFSLKSFLRKRINSFKVVNNVRKLLIKI